MSNDVTSGFGRLLGLKLTHVSAERTEGQLTVTEHHGNIAGNLHGGVIMAVGDILGGRATRPHLPPGATTATLESKTNFFATVRMGETIRAECTPLHVGRTTIALQTKIFRADGKLAAMVTQTQMVIAAKP